MFIHGLDPSHTPPGKDYAEWGSMLDAFRGWGWQTSQMKTWGYYQCDANADLFAQDYAPPSAPAPAQAVHSPATCDGNGYTQQTPISTVARSWAWGIYSLYGSNGICVDVVAHSMAGLIVRYALSATQRQTSGFPPSLCIDRVVTFGTPHLGSDSADFCSGNPLPTQCAELLPDSEFMKELANDAQNPQGLGGTAWLLIGSEDDYLVTAVSGEGMTAAYAVDYVQGNYVHHASRCNYMDPSCSDELCNADLKCVYHVNHGPESLTASIQARGNDGTLATTNAAPWPVRLADLFLATGVVQTYTQPAHQSQSSGAAGPSWHNSVSNKAIVVPAGSSYAGSFSLSRPATARYAYVRDDFSTEDLGFMDHASFATYRNGGQVQAYAWHNGATDQSDSYAFTPTGTQAIDFVVHCGNEVNDCDGRFSLDLYY